MLERTVELEDKNKALITALQDIEILSLTDQLTGLNNRRFLNKIMTKELANLNREVEKSSSEEQPAFAFMVIDIDHFKIINDKYGHDAGDCILKQFSGILQNTCRESDWIVRWGGEEFVIVARGLIKEEIHNLAERIKYNVEHHTFAYNEQHESLNLTCSIGIACFPFIQNNFSTLTWQQTLNIADQALYAAKNNGRNAWVSLIEKNIIKPDTFYQHIINNIEGAISAGLVIYDSSINNRDINFE